MYFKIQGTCFKICALYFSQKTISDFQRLTKPAKRGAISWSLMPFDKRIATLPRTCAAGASECPVLFCDLYIFFATRYHRFEIYTKFAVILTGLWSKNSCGRVRKQERNARETFSTPMRRMKIRCRQGKG